MDKIEDIRYLITPFLEERVKLLKTKKKYKKKNLQKVEIIDGYRKHEIFNVEKDMIFSRNRKNHF